MSFLRKPEETQAFWGNSLSFFSPSSHSTYLLPHFCEISLLYWYLEVLKELSQNGDSILKRPMYFRLAFCISDCSQQVPQQGDCTPAHQNEGHRTGQFTCTVPQTHLKNSKAVVTHQLFQAEEKMQPSPALLHLLADGHIKYCGASPPTTRADNTVKLVVIDTSTVQMPQLSFLKAHKTEVHFQVLRPNF